MTCVYCASREEVSPISQFFQGNCRRDDEASGDLHICVYVCRRGSLNHDAILLVP